MYQVVGRMPKFYLSLGSTLKQVLDRHIKLTHVILAKAVLVPAYDLEQEIVNI